MDDRHGVAVAAKDGDELDESGSGSAAPELGVSQRILTERGWADHLAVPRLTFFAALGAVIAARRPHTDVFELFRPGFRLEEEASIKAAAGLPWGLATATCTPTRCPLYRTFVRPATD